VTRATKLLLAALTPLLVAAGLYATTAPASAVAYGGYTDWKTISAGGSHTCAIRTTSQLYCWGTDGTGSALYPISGYRDWKSVSVGASHRCAVRGTGYLYCWGSDSYGQVGNGSLGSPSTPARVGGSTDWKSVSAGDTHTCGIRGAGILYCWGHDADGQLGNGAGSVSDFTVPTRVGTAQGWKSVSAGGAHTCAIWGNSTLYCWGSDASGQVGNGSTSGDDVSSPTRISAATWSSVSAGGSHSCAVRSDGLLGCWGSDSDGQLGNGTGGDRSAPASTTNATDWKRVSAGANHTCAYRGTGTLYCWGANDQRQSVESSSTSSFQTPQRYSGIYDWKAVDAGSQHTCAIPGSSRIYCWGAQKAPSNGTPAGSAYPASLSSVGYLKAWKVTLPVDGSDAGPDADEIKQPALATYRSLSYFHTNSNNGAVVLRAPVGGATTPGSVFARTELRNMYPYDGVKAVSYNWTSGTHVLEINQAYTHLPKLIPKVVGVQIHDPDHEVLMIRLDGTRLYAQVRQLNGTYTEVTFTNSYQLGTRFNAKVTANANGIFIDYNGVRKASFAGRRPSSSVYWYFKAGCYLHSKTSAGEAPNEYGEVLIYSLKTTHS
jgi:alpha-tubulin suppressor-like RCC1 family protein